MTTSKQYDYLNRLGQISSQGGTGVPPVAYNYNYNQANQRTQDRLADGSYWNYQYDALGQVTAGRRFWADGTVVAGQQFGYAFDTIGNRTQTQTGGDQNGFNLRVANYTVNDLNQITSRDVPGYVEVQGASFATNLVAVNGNTNSYRKVEYFRQEVGVANGSKAVWTNLTNDGRWGYSWDAENRLTGMTVNTNTGPQYQLRFAYDAKGRRIQKIATTNGVAFATNKFLYDGWNLVAELGTNNTLLRNYTWGNDLSDSAQGAGGVGGLLEVAYHGSSATTNAFVAYDGNGNVGSLVNAGDGTVVANYEYGPFGEVICQTGPMAKVNPIRFSTKYQDDESDLLYYGYRYYKSFTSTWLNRDPMEEQGGLNLYGALDGDMINDVDGLGLKGFSITGSVVDGDTTYHYVINFDVDNNGNPSISEIGVDNVLGPLGASVLEIKMAGAITGHIKCCPSPNYLKTIPITFDKHYGENHWYLPGEEKVYYVRGSASDHFLSCCVSALWDVTITVEGQILGVSPTKPVHPAPPITISPPTPPRQPKPKPKPPSPPPPPPKDPCA